MTLGWWDMVLEDFVPTAAADSFRVLGLLAFAGFPVLFVPYEIHALSLFSPPPISVI